MKQEERARVESEYGRPPRGGRGLKQVVERALSITPVSPPAWGAWIETSSRSRSGRS